MKGMLLLGTAHCSKFFLGDGPINVAPSQKQKKRKKPWGHPSMN